MKKEDQIINIDLSKKLKELGVKQNSIFWYSRYSHCKVYFIQYAKNKPIDERIHFPCYSAFTLPELLELLPSINNSHPQLMRGHLDGEDQLKYCCRYGWEDEQNSLFVDINPANSCAKMLIYLIENGYIKND